ncbi:hypothetical protein DS2_10532 [Catenovulum agarivorans DS-2]|uniref:UPF0246 protein DS2_10532 n=1 Tax=Catenovulum agarivorans DS-2 TaxID=1328313 RepID=W7QD82_9ALTE|nr:peroxide stress protein YaaA [Catenovulum agarivorans]EWH09876.1 hypothetical protein DS2_10532 [Catenovulum agarivorans DS-2]
MIIVISPAKNLDYETDVPTSEYTQPELLADSKDLADVCKKLTPLDLSNLMGISDKLAGLNAARFADWTDTFTLDNAKQALFAFNGDVYTGLDAYNLKPVAIEYAQQHLRILSGLYGLLKPLDLMMPYRLEMGTKLENPRGRNLYQFWGNIITNKLNELADEVNGKTLVNLASNEYFKSVKAKEFNGKIISPEFKDWKNGQYKTISFFAKKARGLMARYLIENEIETLDGLRKFEMAGYQYSPELSTDIKPVFCRKEQ